jgi:hypothetical protein
MALAQKHSGRYNKKQNSPTIKTETCQKPSATTSSGQSDEATDFEPKPLFLYFKIDVMEICQGGENKKEN